MDFIASFFPPLSERQPIPFWYQPTAFALTLIPFLSTHRYAAIWTTFPLLVYLCLASPRYTFGDPSSDYYSSGPFLAMLLWYLDFAIYTPATGPAAPVFVGKAQIETFQQLQALRETQGGETIWQRLALAFRLMLPSHRGVGWDWQVKGIPPDPYKSLPRWEYVRVQLYWTVYAYLRSAIMLGLMGFSTALEDRWSAESSLMRHVTTAAVGWTGAIWVWDRLNCFYCLAAACSVALGICDAWEWPPLTGDIRNAWSVRQMWSVVYHQVLRRLVSKPASRMVRVLHLRPGGLFSRYVQLYISFGISCLYHEFEIFNVTRKDMGEFAFFMSQPLAIMFEDFVQWLWRTILDDEQRWRLLAIGQVVGYVWVFVWFSYTLPLYLKGMRDAEIIGDAVFGSEPFRLGSNIAVAILSL